MKIQVRDRNPKKLTSVVFGLMLLPLFAACQPNNTAQAPTTPPVTQQPTTEAPTTPSAPTTTEEAVDDDLVDVVGADPGLTTFAKLIDEAELEDELEEGGPYTLFAPSNEAFDAIPEATRQQLLQPENRETLRQILNNHVVRDSLNAADIESGEVQTIAGNAIDVQVDQTNNEVQVDNARVTQPDLQANNGVVHIIDQVLLPPDFQEQTNQEQSNPSS